MVENFLKRISRYCTECNEINTRHLYIQKHVSCEKWFQYYVFFAYKFTQKFSNTLRPMRGGFFKAYFWKTYIALTVTKVICLFFFFLRWTIVYFIYKIPQKISDILWAMFRNDLKCIFNYASWF